MHTNHSIILYDNTSPMLVKRMVQVNMLQLDNKQKNHVWVHLPEGWYKWNTDSSRLYSKKTKTISYLSKERNEKVLRISIHVIGDSAFNGGKCSVSLVIR